MTAPVNTFKTLTKTDRRKQWQLLKKKHSSAIAKAKIDFDLKLGPGLEKYQKEVDKLAKLAATTELHTNQIQPVLTAVMALDKVVAAYREKVKKLEEPAKKELGALLKSLEDDRKGWAELAQTLHRQAPTAPTPEQRQAAAALIIPLDNLRTMAQTIARRGATATASYKNNKPNPRPAAAALAGRMVEAARLVGPSAHEAADAAGLVARGKNYELFKTQAKAATRHIQNFRKASQAFRDAWDFDNPSNTISAEIDALALKNNHDQIVQFCDDTLRLIAKLP